MNTQNQKIVSSKKCEVCKQNILIASMRTYRPDDSAFKRTISYNKELPHYCDGGESYAIEQHEFSGLRAKVEAYNNFKEWA